MEPLTFSSTGTGFQVEGYPNAVKVIAIAGPSARRVADLALHEADLKFARECLEEINRTGLEGSNVQQALWRTAVVHFMKCYGESAARSQLSPEKVLRSESPNAMKAFHYFKSLRNKHVVHDENPYSQSIPGAILNGPEEPYKIAKIVTFSFQAETLEQDSYSSLSALVDKSLVWVRCEYERLCEKITRDLEGRVYEELLQMPSLEYRTPGDNAVHTVRPKI